MRRVSPARVLVVLTALALASAGYARDKEKDKASYDGSGTFSIELDFPYAKVLEAVRDAAASGIIHGTFEYRDEESLPKADALKSCKYFAAWDGGGEVFFKVRTKALAPAHFVDSMDMGTVAVRYVVQEIGANASRLIIDALFVGDSHHGKHPSDGYVETTEYNLILQRLTEDDRMQKEAVAALAQREHPHAMVQSSSKDTKEQTPLGAAVPRSLGAASMPVSSPAVAGKDEADLHREIDAERACIDAVNGDIRHLQERVGTLRAAATVKVRGNGAELRTFPYIHADALRVIKSGTQLTVLQKTQFWYKVRSDEGIEGWIYHGFLEERE